MNKLKEYQKFIEQFNFVGTTTVFLDNDFQKEVVSTGFMDLEKKIETKNETIYKIASISKVVVAIALLKLYDKKLIDLDEDISLYLGYPVRNHHYLDKKITLRMLLTQTSSINDDGAFVDGVYLGYDGSNQTDEYIPLKDLLTPNSMHYYNNYSDNLPGTNFEYSNLGCGILACVIEKITNKHFRDYVIEELLKPLKIDSGFRTKDIKEKANLATHYYFIDGDFVKNKDYEGFEKVECIEYPIGDNFRGVAGGLYINAIDLSKIMEMLMNKGTYKGIKILEEDTVKEMEKVWWEGKPLDPTYKKKGLQLIIMDEFTKKPLKGHFGNAYGLRSFMLYNENGGLIFLCNGGDFVTDEEHMTIVQEKIIKYLVEKTNI